MHPAVRARLDAAIARKNAERGRPLTSREKLENLARWLDYDLDEDGLDPIQALVCDAAAAEPSRMVHEGGEYYAERIIRRAIAQGTLVLASGIETEGHDPAEGHGAEHESPVANGETPRDTHP